ncbi:tyrosine-type recombinase/integrase [Massilia scottii]|uniref:tyrosine-type recombinase/integrase n=1 Tax=Massilia scottii TaxID=3057166 RepID=UPI0035B5ECCE
MGPTSPDNPWHGNFARERNFLLIQWLEALGIRRGELLGIRISDIDFRNNTVQILRRADDPSDPRRYQPNAKTLDRVLPLSDGLVQMTQNYIINIRRGKKARSSSRLPVRCCGDGRSAGECQREQDLRAFT